MVRTPLLTHGKSYGSIAFLSIIFGYFCIPELKNRSLEEVEKMFEAGIPLRKFGEYETDETVSHLVANSPTKLEAHDTRELPRKQDTQSTTIKSGLND